MMESGKVPQRATQTACIIIKIYFTRVMQSYIKLVHVVLYFLNSWLKNINNTFDIYMYIKEMYHYDHYDENLTILFNFKLKINS